MRFTWTSHAEPTTVLADGQHSADYVFNVARQRRLKAVPVAAPLAMRGPGTDYFEAIARVVSRDGRGAALRVPYEDFANSDSLELILKETVALLTLSPSQVDVYLDANSLALVPETDRDEAELVQTVRLAAKVIQMGGYRRVIFAASELPGSLVRQKKGEILKVARAELRVWRRIVADRSFRFLQFGDYGVIYPGQVESDLQVIPPSRVRLSLEHEYRLYKGSRDAIRSLSQSVVTDGQLHSAQNSWGANAIRECAAGYGDPGGPSQWVARDFNMHIENTVTTIARHWRPDMTMAAASRSSPWLQESLGLND